MLPEAKLHFLVKYNILSQRGSSLWTLKRHYSGNDLKFIDFYDVIVTSYWEVVNFVQAVVRSSVAVQTLVVEDQFRLLVLQVSDWSVDLTQAWTDYQNSANLAPGDLDPDWMSLELQKLANVSNCNCPVSSRASYRDYPENKFYHFNNSKDMT